MTTLATDSMTYIKVSDEMGRGVYALREIPKDMCIAIEELLVFNQKDTRKVNKTDLQFYTYRLDEETDCLVLGNGELYNHSDAPNVSYRLVRIDNRPMMLYSALKTIQPHEQLLIDYSADIPVDISKYTKNMTG